MTKNGPWLKSGIYDFFWFYPFLWAAPLCVFLYSQGVEILYILAPLILVHSRTHLSLPICFGLITCKGILKYDSFKILKMSAFFSVSFLLIFSIGFQFRFFLTAILPSVMVFWAIWHFYKQERGMLSLYRTRDGTTHPSLIQLDRLVCIVYCVLNPTQYWLRESMRLNWTATYFNPKIFDVFLPWWIVHVSCISLLLFYLFMQIRHKKLMTPRTLYVFTLFGQYLILSNLFNLPIYFAWMIRVFMHNSAEIGLQIQMWKNEFENNSAKQKIKLSLLVVALIVPTHIYVVKLYPFITLIHEPGYFDWNKFNNYQNHFLVGSAIFYFAFVNFLHYVVGGYVYNFKNPHVRRVLSFPSLQNIDRKSEPAKAA